MRRGSCWAILLAFVPLVSAAQSFSLSTITGVPLPFGQHALSGDGKRLFFASTGNPVGRNADGNMEVFMYQVDRGTLYQITDTQTTFSGWWNHNSISVNHDGTRIAFRSTFALDVDRSYLNQYDVFVADVSLPGMLASGPISSFRRITTTDERLAMTLSSDGHVLYLASTHNLAGVNNAGSVQVFRIQLDPSPQVTQVTQAAGGLTAAPGDQLSLRLSTNYTGDQFALAASGDPLGTNPDGNMEIFLYVGGNLSQVTDTLSPVFNTDPAMGKSPNNPPYLRMLFTSDGDLVGRNADGNREVFMVSFGGTVLQLTDTAGGDQPFGGAHSNPSLSTNGNLFVVASTRDLAPGGTNADGNREIFLGTISSTGGQASATFEQLTRTTTSSPGAYQQNANPRLSALGNVVAFNSDLDLGLSGNNNVYIAQRPAGTAASITINNFLPSGGGPLVPVNLYGNGFATANRVEFGTLPAPEMNVLSDSHIVALAPVGVATGTITVRRPDGTSATSARNFEAASLRSLGAEFNQGFPDYPAVAGKDALVRIFTATSPSGASWHISDAQLQITDPSGAVSQVAAQMYQPDLANPAQSFSERNNVNFYIPGSMLARPGRYTFTATAQTAGSVVLNESLTPNLAQTKDVVLYFRSVLRHPNADEFKAILKGFETYSRIYPIRSGVGDLQGAIGGNDFSAGLRVAYLAAPIWQGDARLVGGGTAFLSAHCYGEIQDQTMDGLTAINSSSNFEHTEFGIAFIPSDKVPGIQGAVGCPITDCESMMTAGNMMVDGQPSKVFGMAQGDTALVLLCGSPSGVFCHEAGHLLGLDHITAVEDAVIAQPAFNLFTRRALVPPFSTPPSVLFVPGLPNVPLNTMVYNEPLDQTFAHNGSNGGPADYPGIVNRRTLASVSRAPIMLASAVAFVPEPAAAQLSAAERLVLMATFSGGELHVRNAYKTKHPGPITRLDPNGPFTLILRDREGRAIATENLRFHAARRPKRGDDFGESDPARGSLNLIRPVPKGAVGYEIQREGRVLYRYSPRAQGPRLDAPRVKLVENAGGKVLEVDWSGRARADALFYQVEYSRDNGRNYAPLVPSTKQTRVRLDPAGLPGGKAVRFRVTASDGLLRTSAVSRSLALADKPPYAAITHPTGGEHVEPGAPVRLRGRAFDLEDGMLGNQPEDAAFRWYSGKHRIAVGAAAEWIAPTAPGRYRLTLQVRDSSGGVGSDSLVLVVQAPRRALTGEFLPAPRIGR